MTLEEIKAAVLAGKQVCWMNERYKVICWPFPKAEQWLITCDNGSAIGLTWQDGVTMNGQPNEFYVQGEK